MVPAGGHRQRRPRDWAGRGHILPALGLAEGSARARVAACRHQPSRIPRPGPVRARATRHRARAERRRRLGNQLRAPRRQGGGWVPRPRQARGHRSERRRAQQPLRDICPSRRPPQIQVKVQVQVQDQRQAGHLHHRLPEGDLQVEGSTRGGGAQVRFLLLPATHRRRLRGQTQRFCSLVSTARARPPSSSTSSAPNTPAAT